MDINEYRQLLKKHHICRDCGKTDAYTLIGRTYCYECAEKQREAKARARANPEKAEKMRQSKREQIARYIEENKCVRCGKQLTNGKRMCEICYVYQRKATKKSKGCIPRMSGICYQCNKKPCMEGKKLCVSCYEKKIPIALKNLEKSRGGNHPWRSSWQTNLLSPKKE